MPIPAHFETSSREKGNVNCRRFDTIRREIMVHSQIEREIFYSALTSTSSTTAASLVAAAIEDHCAIEKLLQELNGVNTSDRSFETKMARMMDEVIRHIEKEEAEIFDEARKSLAEYRLEELGLEIEDRRKILTQLAA